MDSKRQKREKEIERLVSGAPISRESEAAFREEVRKTAAELFQKETHRIQEDERPAAPRTKKARPLRTWGIGLIVAGAAAVVLEILPLGGLLIFLGVGALFWSSLGQRSDARSFSRKAQLGRFKQRL
jgi:hypothetical protein